MRKSQKQLAEQIDSHIYAMIEGMLGLLDSGNNDLKEQVYATLCDLKRWAMVEWGQIHDTVGLGPFCVFKEKPGKKSK